QVKGGSDFSSSRGRGRGRGGFRERGRGRNSSLQCSFCRKSGHSEKYCWSKPEEANYVQKEDDEQEEYLFMTYTSSDVLTNDVWYLDSACTNHMTCDKSKFKDLDESVRSRVRLGDDKQLHIEGFGTVILTIEDKCKLIKDVQYAPRLAHNLISVSQLIEFGHSVKFDEVALVNNQEMNDVDLWHLRYGHLNNNGLQLLKNKEMVSGLPFIKDQKKVCEGCVLDKQAKKSFPVGNSRRATEVLELVHADLCGPMKSESLSGSKYFLLFTNDFSIMSWVYFLQLKSETFKKFKIFKAFTEKQSGKCLKVLRDRGGEFTSSEFRIFYEEQGIKREMTDPYTPKQNRVAKRKNRTVVEMARSMLKSKGLPDNFWAKGVATERIH
nr:retrovirus-related Pol polyprotein from transposon TNT 1-94 [Tanacetum cinerariifolium]